jgi:Protein of unknown function (DUF4065)
MYSNEHLTALKFSAILSKRGWPDRNGFSLRRCESDRSSLPLCTFGVGSHQRAQIGQADLLARLRERNVPVVGGAYFSMKNGPVTSEVLDLINAGEIADVESTWRDYISTRQNHEIEADKSPNGYLSEAEMGLLDAVYTQHGWRDQWQLRDWCHQHCAEWTILTSGRTSITPSEIARAVGKSEEHARQIEAEAYESAFVESMI